MKLRKLKESKTLKNYEIADMLVANGFENEEEGFLDYFLEDNPKYVASVNLEDMGSYVDDLDEGEHIPLPYANNADRKILRTEEDVEEFLDFIHDLNYSDMFESAKRNRTRRTTKRPFKESRNDNILKNIESMCDEINSRYNKSGYKIGWYNSYGNEYMIVAYDTDGTVVDRLTGVESLKDLVITLRDMMNFAEKYVK